MPFARLIILRDASNPFTLNPRLKSMTAPASTDKLTPSETVLLHGDQFAKKAMLGEKLLLTDVKVSTSELVTAMVTAAILANEKKGFITLTLKKEKALFGLSSRESLKIAPAGAGNGVWPADTTEAGNTVGCRGQ